MISSLEFAYLRLIIALNTTLSSTVLPAKAQLYSTKELAYLYLPFKGYLSAKSRINSAAAYAKVATVSPLKETAGNQ